MTSFSSLPSEVVVSILDATSCADIDSLVAVNKHVYALSFMCTKMKYRRAAKENSRAMCALFGKPTYPKESLYYKTSYVTKDWDAAHFNERTLRGGTTRKIVKELLGKSYRRGNLDYAEVDEDGQLSWLKALSDGQVTAIDFVDVGYSASDDDGEGFALEAELTCPDIQDVKRAAEGLGLSLPPSLEAFAVAGQGMPTHAGALGTILALEPKAPAKGVYNKAGAYLMPLCMDINSQYKYYLYLDTSGHHCVLDFTQFFLLEYDKFEAGGRWPERAPWPWIPSVWTPKENLGPTISNARVIRRRVPPGQPPPLSWANVWRRHSSASPPIGTLGQGRVTMVSTSFEAFLAHAYLEMVLRSEGFDPRPGAEDKDRFPDHLSNLKDCIRRHWPVEPELGTPSTPLSPEDTGSTGFYSSDDLAPPLYWPGQGE